MFNSSGPELFNVCNRLAQGYVKCYDNLTISSLEQELVTKLNHPNFSSRAKTHYRIREGEDREEVTQFTKETYIYIKHFALSTWLGMWLHRLQRN